MLSTDSILTDARRLPAPDRSLKVTPLDMRQMKLSKSSVYRALA